MRQYQFEKLDFLSWIFSIPLSKKLSTVCKRFAKQMGPQSAHHTHVDLVNRSSTMQHDMGRTKKLILKKANPPSRVISVESYSISESSASGSNRYVRTAVYITWIRLVTTVFRHTNHTTIQHQKCSTYPDYLSDVGCRFAIIFDTTKRSPPVTSQLPIAFARWRSAYTCAEYT